MESRANPTMYLGTLSRSIEIGLRSIGVWPNSSYMILGRAFWMITLTMAQTFQYRYFLIHVRTDDLPHLMDGLSVTMSYSLLLLKLIVFWIHRRWVPVFLFFSRKRDEMIKYRVIYFEKIIKVFYNWICICTYHIYIMIKEKYLKCANPMSRKKLLCAL